MLPALAGSFSGSASGSGVVSSTDSLPTHSLMVVWQTGQDRWLFLCGIALDQRHQVSLVHPVQKMDIFGISTAVNDDIKVVAVLGPDGDKLLFLRPIVLFACAGVTTGTKI